MYFLVPYISIEPNKQYLGFNSNNSTIYYCTIINSFLKIVNFRFKRKIQLLYLVSKDWDWECRMDFQILTNQGGVISVRQTRQTGKICPSSLLCRLPPHHTPPQGGANIRILALNTEGSPTSIHLLVDKFGSFHQ